MSFRILDYAGLQRLEPPQWLVDNVIPSGPGGSLGVLFGKPGTAKSFVALDMAHCISTGLDWHGRQVHKGRVVYLAAEGALGFKGRAYAWAKSRGFSNIPRAHYVLDPVNLMDMRNVETFMETMRADLPGAPDLVIIDTLARSMPGGDENETKDMSAAVTGLGRIQTLGCVVMVVHHQGHNEETDRARGSSVLPGACDFMLRTEKKGKGVIKLHCFKQKDADEFDAMTFDMKPYAGSIVLEVASNLLRLSR